MLQNYLNRLPVEQRQSIPAEELDMQRWRLVRQVLPQSIDTKLIYLDFLRAIPKDRLPDIQDGLYRQFDETQLPLMVQRANVQTAADLDRLLRSFGTSLDQQRHSFAEQLVAAQWKRQHGRSKQEISHEDLLTYYTEHRDEFQFQATAKWEQLLARFDEFPTREAAWKAVTRMGNEVYRGAPLAAVARRSSQGPTAAEGGVYDWTTKGSLKSEILNEAIFALPVGRLSQRLEDEEGWHIIRVTQRLQEGVVPFLEAQATIKEKIQKERAEAALTAYVEKLRAETPISTVFDDLPPLAP